MPKTDNPLIMLFGMPRSGTTWIGKTFDSHPDVSYRHEPDSQFRLNDILPLLPDPLDCGTYSKKFRDYLQNYLPRCSPRTCGKRPVFPKSTDTACGRGIRQTVVTAAKVLERLLGRAISWNASPKGPVVWKSIESVGRLGTLLRLLPNARGVLILRDPRGYVASVLRGEASGKFLAKDAISNDWPLFEKLCGTPYARRCQITLAQLQALHPEQRLAWMWVLFNQKAMDELHECDNGLIVRYEDICKAPSRTFQELFAFCGLDWHPQSASFVDASTGGHTASESYYSVYKDPLTSAYKWQSELSADQLKRIEDVAFQHPVGKRYASNPGPV